MHNRHSHFFLPLLLALTALSSVDAAPVPRVVVNILIDQLRGDYLEAFMPLYGTHGFKRLIDGGVVFRQAETASDGADRAATAASIACGTTPADHGITGQRWFDRQTQGIIACTDAQGGFTPRYLTVSTIGDELKVATEGKALVYSIAPWTDAALLTAGHAADAALWIDSETGLWRSSDYYGALPTWAALQNSRRAPMAIAQNATWQPTDELVGTFSYFLSGGRKEPFSHTFQGPQALSQFLSSGLVNTEVAALASACIESTQIGRDELTDYLAVSFYAGNFNHLPANSAPMELQDTYVRLDRAVANLIEALEHHIGLDRVLFCVTSTGSTDEETDDLRRYRLPSGTLDVQRTASLLNMYLAALYGQGRYVDGSFGTWIYLNHKLIEDRQLSLSDVLSRAEDFLLQVEGVKDVYTSRRLLQGAWTPGISRIRAGFNPLSCGDIRLQVSPGWRFVNNETHENTLVRASYVPFPIIFFGYGLTKRSIETPVSVDRIAPTLAGQMRIRAPSACNQPPLSL